MIAEEVRNGLSPAVGCPKCLLFQLLSLHSSTLLEPSNVIVVLSFAVTQNSRFGITDGSKAIVVTLNVSPTPFASVATFICVEYVDADNTLIFIWSQLTIVTLIKPVSNQLRIIVALPVVTIKVIGTLIPEIVTSLVSTNVDKGASFMSLKLYGSGISSVPDGRCGGFMQDTITSNFSFSKSLTLFGGHGVSSILAHGFSTKILAIGDTFVYDK